MIEGLPDGIGYEIIDHLCRERFFSPLQAASHQHLSAWKPTGAYRLLLKLAGGREESLILKEASYESDEIPAMAGLGIDLGEAEFCIYSQAAGPLEPFLPAVYLAERVVPGARYRYILEDLSVGYERIGAEKAMLRASALLPDLHHALKTWSAEADTQGLLRYGMDFSRILQDYARANFEQIHPRVSEPIFDTVLRQWKDITALHLQPHYFQPNASQPVHGDSNFTNVHLAKGSQDRIKLVDWEWAGFALPIADLVSLTKGAAADISQKALQAYSQAVVEETHFQVRPDMPPIQQEFDWCQFERGMLDAAFLSAQYLHSDHQANFSLPKAIRSSLHRMYSAYLRLSG